MRFAVVIVLLACCSVISQALSFRVEEAVVKYPLVSFAPAVKSPSHHIGEDNEFVVTTAVIPPIEPQHR